MKIRRLIIVLAVGFILNETRLSRSSNLEELQDAFSGVAESVGPSVVSISTIQTYRVEGGYMIEPFGFSDRTLSEFIQKYFLFSPETELQKYGLGSGIIVREDGYILTNNHVVQGASGIEVTLGDGRKYKAQVKGKDTRSDLAVLKINQDHLPVAKLGESSKVKTGQWVVAIGNPFGFMLKDNQPTVTVGVVSATHRRLPDIGMGGGPYYFDLIQTDAAINAGNSGGPLANLKGEVIGINMAIFTNSGGYSGVGFAIPIGVAKSILNDLIEGEHVVYGWLGVGVGPVDRRMAKELKMPDQRGALVLKVFEDSSAEISKIKELDVIQKIGDRSILSPEDLIREVASLKSGMTVKINLIRKGESMDVDVVLTPHPTEKLRTKS